MSVPTDAPPHCKKDPSDEPMAGAGRQRMPAVEFTPEAPKLLIRSATARDVVALARLIVQ
jgi:hypothetical protein